jgi:hypothetical protein
LETIRAAPPAASRLPLYLLPVFVPLALAAAKRLTAVDSPADVRRRHAWLGAWCLFLLLVKGVAGHWPEYRDTRRLAHELRAIVRDPSVEVVAVDVNRNALPFYGVRIFEWVTTAPDPYPFFILQESLGEEISEMRYSPRRHLFILPPQQAGHTWKLLLDAGAGCQSGRIPGLHFFILCQPLSARVPPRTRELRWRPHRTWLRRRPVGPPAGLAVTFLTSL